MEDFFTNETVDDEVLNADDLLKHKKSRIDIRYHRAVSTVTSAEKAGDYKVKVWPTLEEGDNNVPSNALGIRIDTFERRKKAQLQELQRFKLQKRKEIYDEIYALAQEELELIDAENQKPAFTVEELEQIRDEGYNEGLNQGLEEGRAKGFEEGSEKGYQEGLEKGISQGVEKGYQDGLKQGVEDGFSKGHSEGIESGQSVVLEQVERFRSLADSLANPLRELDRDVTDEICYIISRLCKVIIKKEINKNEEFLQKTVEQAISILPNAQKGATVYLNPEDAALVLSALSSEYLKEQHWDIKEDPTLEIGDVKVTNDISSVDWRVNDRIDSLLEDFLSSVYPNVNSALKESIEGCPEFDEVPKKKLTKRNLSDIKDSILQSADPTSLDNAIADEMPPSVDTATQSNFVNANDVNAAAQANLNTQNIIEDNTSENLNPIQELEMNQDPILSDADAASILQNSAKGPVNE